MFIDPVGTIEAAAAVGTVMCTVGGIVCGYGMGRQKVKDLCIRFEAHCEEDDVTHSKVNGMAETQEGILKIIDGQDKQLKRMSDILDRWAFPNIRQQQSRNGD